MNIKGLVYKLQKALLQKGRKIKINQSQYYSEKFNKMSTKFIVKEQLDCPGGKKKERTILETYSMVDIAYKLADMLNDGGE